MWTHNFDHYSKNDLKVFIQNYSGKSNFPRAVSTKEVCRENSNSL